MHCPVAGVVRAAILIEALADLAALSKHSLSARTNAQPVPLYMLTDIGGAIVRNGMTTARRRR